MPRYGYGYGYAVRSGGAGGGVSVGGVQVGSIGSSGIYDGLQLLDGDDFTASIDNLIVTPARPTNPYFGNTPYGSPRGGSASLPAYVTDVGHTGYLDANKGVPVALGTQQIVDGTYLRLQARATSAGEKALLNGKDVVSADIHTAGRMIYYPGTVYGVLVEGRYRRGGTLPGGDHPAFWTYTPSTSLNPATGNEFDISENGGGTTGSWAAFVDHNGGVLTGLGTFPARFDNYTSATTPHTYSAFLKKSTTAPVYADGVSQGTYTDGNLRNAPGYLLMTHHVLNSGFHSDTYDLSGWNSAGNTSVDGSMFDIDWWRIWGEVGIHEYEPLVTLDDVNVDYAGTASIILPSKTALWGDAGVVENVQCWVTDGIDPGGSHTTNISQFPTGVSYNSGTRTITVDFTLVPTGNAGRLYFTVECWNTEGSICRPARFVVNRGPSLNITALNVAAGAVSFNLYAACDCGTLVTDTSGQRAKTIIINSGLSGSGLTYNDTTGLLTGTAVAGAYTLSITITNSVGQTVTQSLPLSVTAATSYAYQSWSGNAGWFDASDGAAITAGRSITVFKNKVAAAGDLTVSGTVGKITHQSGQNNRLVARLVRDVSSVTAVPKASALPTDAVSQLFHGGDQPYVAIVVFKPTDTNTSFIWTSSYTASVSTSEQLGYVRRNATASSVRKQPVSVSNDVNFSSGEASGTAFIVAILHTGTAVTVWKNSTTATITASAQDVATMSTSNIFRLFASAQQGSTDPTIALTQGNMDFCEMIVSGTQTSGDIQQAITDLAAKWGITLS